MRLAVLVVSLVAASTAVAIAQPAVFGDVPPWHWAFDAIRPTGSAGVFVGYPTSDAEAAFNAITQVYETFAHASHPEAQGWAERFLAEIPSNWPRPLTSSRLLGFRLENPQPALSGGRGSVTFVAVVVLRQNGGSKETRTRVRVDVQKDTEARWRVKYSSLASGQPQVFK